MQTKKQKLDKLKQFTDQTLREITESPQSFKKFLDFSARLYKYRFEDALLIYAQNPNAVACATFELWNKIDRRIHKGTKAMHVYSGDSQSQIKYLFELDDTYGKAFTYPINFTIPEHHKESLLKSFNTKLYSDDFNKNFKWCIETYVQEHYNQFIDDYKLTKKNLKNKDALTEESVKKTISECVSYTLCQRFNIPKTS